MYIILINGKIVYKINDKLKKKEQQSKIMHGYKSVNKHTYLWKEQKNFFNQKDLKIT